MCTKARDHYGTDETVPPAANSLDAYTRSKTEAEALVIEYHQKHGLPGGDRAAGIHLRRARPHRPAQTPLESQAGQLHVLRIGRAALNCIYVKNLVSGIFLAAENPAAVGEVFNLTDGQTVTKKQFVGRVAELAGLKAPTRRLPLGLARSWPMSSKGAQAPRRQEPSHHQ